jgi:hypothetical protein
MDQHLGRKCSGREEIGCRREDESTVNKTVSVYTGCQDSLTMKMETLLIFDTSVTIYQLTVRNFSQILDGHQHTTSVRS